MVLSGLEIKNCVKGGSIFISPYFEEFVGNNSYDVHLGSVLLEVVVPIGQSALSPFEQDSVVRTVLTDKGFTIYPGRLYLGVTMEYTETYGYLPILNGRSSLARKGLSIHQTAGFGDDGFKGFWTLELSTILPFKLYPGMPIGQIVYLKIDGSNCESNGYSLKSINYANTTSEPIPSNIHLKQYWKKFFLDKEDA